MGLSKRARNVASISNRTSVFGIMGGVAPRSRIAANQSAMRNKARSLPQVFTTCRVTILQDATCSHAIPSALVV